MVFCKSGVSFSSIACSIWDILFRKAAEKRNKADSSVIKGMLKLYYRIWVDAITKMRSLPKNAGVWKFYSMSFISTAMTLNLFVILIFLKDIGLTQKVAKFHFNFFSNSKFDGFLSFLFSYFLPFLLINYFLIFYKDRYKELIKQYKPNDGKLFIKYFFGSLGLLFVYVLIAFIIVKLS